MKPLDVRPIVEKALGRRGLLQVIERTTLTPAQCRAARGFLGWDDYDLEDASGVEVDEIREFEGGHASHLAHPDRFRLVKAFRAMGVTVRQTKRGEEVLINHHPDPSDAPSGAWDDWRGKK